MAGRTSAPCSTDLEQERGVKSGAEPTNANPAKDEFLAMVDAKAEVELPLSDFQPRSMLETPVHLPERARFPVIDYHNHLDAQDPDEMLRIMDVCGVETIVNITMK